MRVSSTHRDIPAEPGTYALVLPVRGTIEFDAGRLGLIRVHSGVCVYVGSAFGPGGLHARIAHHARSSSRPHWHVDYLRLQAPLAEVWWLADHRQREHDWARAFAAIRGAAIPAARFGSSDCRCPAHLLHFSRRPAPRTLLRRLRLADPAHPPFRTTAGSWVSP